MFREYSPLAIMMVCICTINPSLLVGDEPDNLKINSINAQFIESTDSGILKLTGNVIIDAGEVELWSDEATYDPEKELILLKGNIKALSRNLSVNAETLEADFQKNKFLLYDSSFNFINRAFGDARLINIEFNDEIELLNVSISSCEKESDSWDLISKKIIITDDRKNVIIRDVIVELSNIPILYIPYLRTGVGNDSFSGFLSPSIKQGKDGLDLSIPYFFSFASNYDLTITPRYIEERGSGISSEGRFLSENSFGNLALTHFSNDRKYSDEVGKSEKRWASKLNTTYKNNSGYIKIFSEHVSDNLFFEDLDDDILGTQQKDFLTRNVSIGIDINDLKFKGQLNQFQNLNPFLSNDYDTEPNFNFEYKKRLNSFKFKLLADYSKFSFREYFNPYKKSENLKRKYFEPSVGIDLESITSKSSFTAGFRKTDYKTSSQDYENSYSWAEISHEIFMEKISNDRFSSLNPVIKLIWIDGDNDFERSVDSKFLNLNYETIFRKNWFTGSDLFLERDRLILGIEYNSYEFSSYKERSFSFGRAFFNKEEKLFADNSKNSSYVSDFKFNLIGDFKFNGSFELSSELKKIERGHVGIIYENDEKRNIQLRSIYKRQPKYLNNPVIWKDFDKPINQLEFIGQWSIGENFLLFSKVLKDEEIDFTRDLSFGIEYSNCCLKIGLMKRKWTDQDYYSFYNAIDTNIFSDALLLEKEKDNIYIFFELTEIGRFGKKISEVLRSKRFQ